MVTGVNRSAQPAYNIAGHGEKYSIRTVWYNIALIIIKFITQRKNIFGNTDAVNILIDGFQYFVNA